MLEPYDALFRVAHLIRGNRLPLSLNGQLVGAMRGWSLRGWKREQLGEVLLAAGMAYWAKRAGVEIEEYEEIGEELACLEIIPEGLSWEHWSELVWGSGIGMEWVKRLGFQSWGQEEVVQYLGFPVSSGGLAIPYYGLDFIRVRLDRSDVGGRYRQRMGSGNHLYLIPGQEIWWREVGVPLLIVEGEKKAACLASWVWGLVVGIAGVWSWGKKGATDFRAAYHGGGKEMQLNEEFEKFQVKGREIIIIGDRDLKRNAQGRQGLERLAMLLRGRGGKVRLTFTPCGCCKGIDDSYVTHGKKVFKALGL
ncbi:MAG: DUF3854 domain-containing protein [Nitrososphaerota archaeon]